MRVEWCRRIYGVAAVLVRGVCRVCKLTRGGEVLSAYRDGNVPIARDVNTAAAGVLFHGLLEPRTEHVSVEWVTRQLLRPQMVADLRTVVALRFEQLYPWQNKP